MFFLINHEPCSLQATQTCTSQSITLAGQLSRFGHSKVHAQGSHGDNKSACMRIACQSRQPGFRPVHANRSFRLSSINGQQLQLRRAVAVQSPKALASDGRNSPTRMLEQRTKSAWRLSPAKECGGHPLQNWNTPVALLSLPLCLNSGQCQSTEAKNAEFCL